MQITLSSMASLAARFFEGRAGVVLIIVASICTPVLAPLCIFVAYRENPKNAPFCALGMGLVFAYVGFLLGETVVGKAETGYDLGRYMAMIPSYADKTLWEALGGLVMGQQVSSSSFYYTTDILFWMSAKLGNASILPAIELFIAYGASSYILFDYSRRNRWSFAYLLSMFAVFLLILPIVRAVAYSRSTISIFLILLAFYRDLYCHKRGILTLLLYLGAVFSHLLALGFLVLRLLTPIAKRLPILAAIFSGVLMFVAGNFTGWLVPLFKEAPGLSLIAEAASRASLYLGHVEAVTSTPLLELCRLMFVLMSASAVVFCFVIIGWGQKSRSKVSLHAKPSDEGCLVDLASVSMLWGCFTIGAAVVLNVDLCMRFAMPFIPLWLLLLSEMQVPPRVKHAKFKRFALWFVFAVVFGLGVATQAKLNQYMFDFGYVIPHLLIGPMSFLFGV